MQHLKESVKSSLNTQNWYAVLTLALTLPYIAGKIDDAKAGSSKRYSKWFDKYIDNRDIHNNGHIFLSGNDCYALRSSFLH